MKRLALIFAMLCPTLLSGCIVQDIRDEMRAANGQLLCVQEGLDKANTGLKEANAALAQTNERLDKVDQGLTRLDRTNSLIDNVEQGLGRIDRTNASLTGLEKQLALLQSIETSLGRLDQHLTAVRKTMASLDGIVPFLDLDTGPVTDAPPVPVAIAPAGNVPPEAVVGGVGVSAASTTNVGDATEPGTAARATRDPLLGVWMSQYPDKDHVLILQTGGRYLRSAKDRSSTYTITRGSFAKEPGAAASLRFTPDPSALTANGTQPTPTAKDTTPPPPPQQLPFVMQVVSQGARSLALEREGVVYVYSRP